MPPMAHMDDIELAAVLNYVLTHFGNEQHLPPDAALYFPEHIGIGHGQGISPWEVNTRRPEEER